MSIDQSKIPAYQYPADDAGPTPDLPTDPGFSGPRNPDGSDIGPLYLSPEAEKWVDQNVLEQGYLIDWGRRVIFDPETGDVIGPVPTSIPRMI